jgi:hypothetical protein
MIDPSAAEPDSNATNPNGEVGLPTMRLSARNLQVAAHERRSTIAGVGMLSEVAQAASQSMP